MDTRSRLSIKEPGAHRRQAMIAAMSEINAERIENVMYGCKSVDIPASFLITAHLIMHQISWMDLQVKIQTCNLNVRAVHFNFICPNIY